MQRKKTVERHENPKRGSGKMEPEPPERLDKEHGEEVPKPKEKDELSSRKS